ncbi:MAG: TetR/AcrR family transcriptional regulator [Acidimicrobiia bacterium]
MATQTAVRCTRDEGTTVGRYQAGIETEARIIDATRSLLADGGLEAATLKAICDRAEVRAGSFYNLFGSKEEAILQVVREAIDAVDPDPEHVGSDTVDDLVNAYIRFFEEQPQLARVYVLTSLTSDSSGDGARKQFLRHHKRRVERFADAMVRSQSDLAELDAEIQAELLLGALDGLAVRWALDTTFAFSDYARRAADRFGYDC